MSFLDAAILVSAMVAALVSGLYAGFGLRADTDLDKKAELTFAAFMWVAALLGVSFGGPLGLGMVNGTQVLLICWSIMHFPQMRTLETPMPRLFPLYTLVISIVCVALMAIGVVVSGLP